MLVNVIANSLWTGTSLCVGTMHYINGDFYTGNFHDGKREGTGLCLLDNGDSLDGEWKNDEFVGEC